MDSFTLLTLGPVVPVIVLTDAGVAPELGAALVAGGIKVLEVTLRTKAALAAIRRLREEVPDAIVGAGTVRNRAHLEAALEAGAQFAVSPGLTPELAAAARGTRVPFIPGVATPSEAMRAEDEGFSVQKLFPAESVGGIKLLQAMASPLPELRFCPTGGIHAGNAGAYLALPNVLAVGGSWLTPEPLIAARDWAAITRLAAEAAALRRNEPHA
ncbi:bifunctional 4-hydroxy-2-oxoglutarate aldolase/2-dehydro-3-deoxy-phosphogluconate aldolase [Crenobacter cavernae]|uniref:2-dehydro-3-deoxy-phosphogluconate aldolase n=1 Tax=Crenobacter cavernae TaxID=2290923 RepID=A0ABY0FGU5_9NEIS|nr:bifunctional 4-hydroxy-2-oxoglutarate aldolase/2-dehydro-3-deoxy-phosphogluconate aldolase [Crenobacter cavernae]RXZ44404.1 bifunctional 4-hydroxy-2-oxoglutarate aldolase/2-dehydro-3-deoxy-phosphogluconate aldolase [Crenobacter cavernae]